MLGPNGTYVHLDTRILTLLTSSFPDAEALQVTFDPAILSYATLLAMFYKMHDPTTLNRQGGDAGTQYRSAIFYHNEEQGQLAKEITEKAQAQWWRSGKISTQIIPAGEWYTAEQYHRLFPSRVQFSGHVADLY